MARTWVALRVNRLLDAALGLLLERPRVVAEVLLVLAKDTRCEPKFADIHFVKKFREATAVILIGMREGKRGQVRAPILLWQACDQLVDDRPSGVFVVLRPLKVVQVDLQVSLGVDDDCRAVAVCNGPENQSARGKFETHGAFSEKRPFFWRAIVVWYE